jgi:hypothetical protein
MNDDLELNIEDLVLDGFPQGDRRRIAEAIQKELTRLLLEAGIPAGITGGAGLDRIDGGSFEVDVNAGAGKVGAQVARAVYGGMNR